MTVSLEFGFAVEIRFPKECEEADPRGSLGMLALHGCHHVDGVADPLDGFGVSGQGLLVQHAHPQGCQLNPGFLGPPIIALPGEGVSQVVVGPGGAEADLKAFQSDRLGHPEGIDMLSLTQRPVAGPDGVGSRGVGPKPRNREGSPDGKRSEMSTA